MKENEYMIMSNGLKLPFIGLGTSLSSPNDKVEFKNALKVALSFGYKNLDTAAVYGTEEPIGEILHELMSNGDLERKDVFLTTKLPAYANKPKVAEELLERSLKNLGADHIDLYLIHSPMAAMPNKTHTDQLNDENGFLIPDDVDLLDTWRFMERAYKEGKVKSIGLSNFNVEQLKRICDKCEIKPHCLQIEYHIFLRQHDLISFCHEQQICVIAYGPFGSPSRSLNKKGVPQVDCLNHPIVQELSQKYGKTAGQILLRLYTQQKIACIPKSVNTERIRQNIQIFDFELSEEDCKKFEAIEEKARLFAYPKMMHHPNYPFKNE